MTVLISGLILFLGVHSVSIFNVSWRDRMVNRVGLISWQGIYSVVAIAGLIMIIKGYGLAQEDPIILYSTPEWLRYVSLALLLGVFPLIFATYLPGKIKSITKHPMLAGTKLWALSHLLVNGAVADVVLFGSFLLWAVIDRISMKHRSPARIPGIPANRFNDAIAFILGFAVYAALLAGLHESLFGAAPI